MVYDRVPPTTPMETDEDIARQAAVAGVTLLDAAFVRPIPQGSSLLDDDIRIAADLIWTVPELREMQIEALLRLFNKNNELR